MTSTKVNIVTSVGFRIGAALNATIIFSSTIKQQFHRPTPYLKLHLQRSKFLSNISLKMKHYFSNVSHKFKKTRTTWTKEAQLFKIT